MRLALVYNPTDHKLSPDSYSWTYRSQFLAIQRRFECQHVITDCDSSSIEADAILFYDVHSSHHIIIRGISKHPAVKFEYFNDPHQVPFSGFYKDGQPVRKLGDKERCQRALDRGVNYIICPYRDGFFRFLKPHLGTWGEKMLLWLPLAVDDRLFAFGETPLSKRKHEIINNGHTTAGRYFPDYYEFRNWAAKQPHINDIKHNIMGSEAQRGSKYGMWLSQYLGSLASCNYYPIPKYFEIPAAGCVPLVQHHIEYEDLGFTHGKNCLYVDKQNLNDICMAVKTSPAKYQHIATAGRKHVLDNFTTEHFANKLHAFINKCR